MDSYQRKNKLALRYHDDRFPMIASFNPKSFEQTLAFKPNAGDIFVAGYPKSGSTWTQYIVWDLIHKGVPLPNVNDIWTKEFPHLEMVGTDNLSLLTPPRLLKVNLPFQYTPYHSLAKYIYIIRNPWDSCVSYYNFMKILEPNYADATFDEFFESFMKGDVSHGDYCNHILSWYKHWDDKNFLFLSYEGLKSDCKAHIRKIANFIDKNIDEDQDILEKVYHNIQFNNMKDNCKCYYDLSEDGNFKVSQQKRTVPFFRKGEIGGWKEYFSTEQYRRLKEYVEKRFSQTEILSLWKQLTLP